MSLLVCSWLILLQKSVEGCREQGLYIAHREIGSMNGCNVASLFKDDTMLQLALFQTDATKEWVILFSNPEWNSWISTKPEQSLWMGTTKPWRVYFSVSDDNALILENAQIEIVNSMANTNSLALFNDDKQPITAALNMKDLEDALLFANKRLSEGRAFLTEPQLRLTVPPRNAALPILRCIRERNCGASLEFVRRGRGR